MKNFIKYFLIILIVLPCFFIMPGCDKEKKFSDYEQYPAGLYQNRVLVKTWEKIKTENPEAFVENSIVGDSLNKKSYLTSLSGILVVEYGVRYITSYSFAECIDLEGVVIPNSVETLGEHAFEKCSKLKDVKLSSMLFYIENFIFKDCLSLENVILPSKIDAIRDFVFENCISLKSINIPCEVESFGTNAFVKCPISSIFIPKSVDNIWSDAFKDCLKLKTAIIDSYPIVHHLTSETSCGGLMNYVDTIYIRYRITSSDLDYFYDHFTYMKSDMDGYEKYVKIVE